MSIDSTGPVRPGIPAEGAGGASSSTQADKPGPSAFDKVMESPKRDYDPNEGRSFDREKPERFKRAERSDRPGHSDSSEGKKRASREDGITIPLEDISTQQQLMSRTMERPSGPGFAPVATHGLRGVSQKIVDEMVQAVRVGNNQLGDKELQFDLKSGVMDGMTIRVSVHDGKITTCLQVNTFDAKNQLESHMAELQQGLEAKGVKNMEVNVEFRDDPRESRQQADDQQRKRERERLRDEEAPPE